MCMCVLGSVSIQAGMIGWGHVSGSGHSADASLGGVQWARLREGAEQGRREQEAERRVVVRHPPASAGTAIQAKS